MTQEILEYNKRCAEFLGWKYVKDGDVWNPEMSHDYSFVYSQNLKFHSDWNWIMEVVEAIEKLGAKYYLGNKSFAISYTLSEDNWYEEETIVKTNIRTKEAAVQAINQFLIWYEKNK